MKRLTVKPTRNYVLYIVGGILLCLAAVLFCPLWEKTDLPWATWGRQIIDLIIAAFLFIYLFGYLIRKLTRGSGVVNMLTVIEFTLLTLIALGCILSQFRVLNISGACTVLGFCLWCRGVVEIFRAYYYQRGGNTRYPVWWLCVAIAMVSFGMYCIARPLFSDVTVLWIFVVALLIVGILTITVGVLSKPKSKSKK